jgi:iron complex outermembrane receptor protein
LEAVKSLFAALAAIGETSNMSTTVTLRALPVSPRAWLACAAAPLILATFPAGTAWAQTAPVQPDAAQDATQVDEIVVTARRREERLIDVPLAVTALSSETLSNSGVDSVQELGQTTPGFYVTRATVVPQPTIRGIGPRGSSAGDESIVPFYIDGVYQPQMVGLFFDLNNVARVEVLRGPQGTLYGRNATGGAVNIVTRTPTTDPAAELTLGYGSFNERIASGYVSGGVGNWAADLAIYASKDDGYVHDVTQNIDLAVRESFAARTKLVWTPSDHSQFTLAYAYSETSDNAGLAPQVIGGNTISRATVPTVLIPTAPYEVSLSLDPFFTTRQNALSFTGKLNFSAFDVTAVTGWQRNDGRVFSDSDATAVNSATLRYDQFGNSWNQEVYATSNGSGPFKWTVGAFYFHDSSGYDPRYQTPQLDSEAISDAYAVYAEGTYDFTDAWSLTVGGRYSEEEKSYTATAGATFAAGDVSFSSFKPSASLQFKPNRDFNLYLRYSEAFKAGVFNTSIISDRAVLPEDVTQTELGLKWRLSPEVRFEGAIYDTQYENIQVTARDPVTGTTFLQNAAAASLTGAEGFLALTPTPGLNLRFGGSYIDAVYDSFPNAQVYVPRPTGGNQQVFQDLSGKTLYKVPEWSGIVGGDYTWDLASGASVVWAVNASYTGKVFWDAANRLSEPSYTLVNSSLTWTSPDQRYKVAVWGNNLIDETYFLSATSSPSADFGSYGRPRSFGVRLSLAYP